MKNTAPTQPQTGPGLAAGGQTPSIPQGQPDSSRPGLGQAGVTVVTPMTINPAPTQTQTGQGLTVDQIAGGTIEKRTSVEVELSPLSQKIQLLRSLLKYTRTNYPKT